MTIEEKFKAFWKAYPRNVGKGAAEKAFAKIKPSDKLLETMLNAIETQKKSADWQRDGGQYIPHPSTWLNQKRWEDDLEKPKPPTPPPKKSGKYDGVYL
jgi:hypothetical protein